MRALLDTNIVYDVLCKRPFDEGGLEAMKIMHAFSDVELWVSAKSYTDLFYLMSHEISNEESQDLLEDSLSWLHVCSIDETDIARALQARWADFEDCLVNICAQKVKADYLVTRDEKGFKLSAIPHGSASEFMSFVSEKTNTTYTLGEF